MNLFLFIWYPTICLIFLYIVISFSKVPNNSIQISENEYLQRLWNFPFYFAIEIMFWILALFQKNNKKQINNINKELSKENVQVVIPAHNAEQTIRDNLNNIITIFPNKIWIADNNNKNEENESLKNFCFINNTNYVHYNIPNKTNAIYETVKKIKIEKPSTKYIVLLDDDTVLCENFFIRTDILNEPAVGGYCCCIGINKNKENINLWEHWIDFEYRTISFRNNGRNLFTQKFLHGIICVYKIDVLLEVFKWNYCLPNGLPFGEDAFAGVQARMFGYKLKQDNENYVLTYCPTKLFSFNNNRQQGFGASSIFKQRSRRWYLSWIRRIPAEIALFLCYDTGTWIGNILYRIDNIWYIFLLFASIHWVQILSKVLYYNNINSFLFIHIAFFITTILISYFRLVFIMTPIEKKNVQWFVPITYPLFLLTLLFLYASSFFISIFNYIPFYRINYKKIYKHI
jgi:hypothetical protein